MKQAMEDGVSEVLSSVVKDVDQAVSRNINGAQLLHELLSAPWLCALLKIYECLLKFQRLTPSPVLPYAAGLSHEVITAILTAQTPSAPARELCSLLSSPHIQALLSSHDSVAQSDYEPVLPPLPDEIPEDEEAMRIVCLVKNNQPLSGEECRRSVGEIHSRWSSLRRFTLERLIPARRAQSGEELRVPESEAKLPLVHKDGRSHPFLPRYESTGSCYLCSPTVRLGNKGLNQSAPSVLNPATCTEELKPNGKDGASTRESSDDYSYPPPPVPAYSFSLPNSPVLYKKNSTGGQSRNIPTPGRTSSCRGMNPLRSRTAPSSPATRRSTREQGVSTISRRDGCQTTQTRPHNTHQEESLNHPLMFHYATAPRHNGCQNISKRKQNAQQQQSRHHNQPAELNKQCSVEELRSTVQMVASSIEHNSQDVRQLGERMVAASEMITDSVEENAQALNLLAEVVDKLQGLIVTKNHLESSPPQRKTQQYPPSPPPRVSSLSPKLVRKSPTPYPGPLSPSSSITFSSSSSTSSCADDFTTSRSPTQINGGSKRMVAAPQRAGRGGNNGQVRFNTGTISRAPLEDQQDCKSTGCLKTKKKKKKV
ncbi:uncharacterized protein LOC134644232 isoform X2 [Pelmatolapia mariae]|uniref:uncharacterized protein LOC134644232 isoform X2 n=1 Tax=Pelmatolapia mariae TaxID=158779 RepID=UPI002FE5A40B